MGGGSWSASTYSSTTAPAAAAGKAFAYSSTTRSAPPSSWAAHDDLKVIQPAGPASPFAGENMRESRDNVEHPNATPLAIFFDQTGSMGEIPAELVKKLGEIYGMLLRKGYCDDPQVMVGAYGDATNHEHVPLQASQFESDNRIDSNLTNLFLEGNGGGNAGETSTLVPYFLSRHTATDAWDKRNKKGYAFIIGDECALPVTATQVKQYIGDDIQGTLTPEDAFASAMEQWDIYILLIDNYAARSQNSMAKYRALVGDDHVIVLEHWQAVCETIAGVIGLAEGNIDLDDLTADLTDAGSDPVSVGATTKALAHFSSGGRVATTETPDDLAVSNAGGTRRL